MHRRANMNSNMCILHTPKPHSGGGGPLRFGRSPLPSPTGAAAAHCGSCSLRFGRPPNPDRAKNLPRPHGAWHQSELVQSQSPLCANKAELCFVSRG